MKMKRCLAAIAVAVFVSGCVSETAGSAGSGNAMQQINAYRASRGLQPLSPHPVVRRLAEQHSRDQARAGRMGHFGWMQRVAQARAAGLHYCTENVGYNHRSDSHLVTRWSRSSGHRAHLLRPNLRYGAVSRVGAYSTFIACE
ncbi:CAP domain-containing protein [Arvimicrobium flavum]|uniref:CAP domain-containing protein n=1 Tax=Arvimicrobium flavum TaxID=3393320 RepID=UPI00237C0E37|nr:CAP domain-containing protein [Mesorhizobium shangrilense]